VDRHQECAVCKVEYEEGEECIVMPCEHIFHGECIKTWLKMHNTCPICRWELPTDDKEYERAKELRQSQQRDRNQQQQPQSQPQPPPPTTDGNNNSQSNTTNTNSTHSNE